MEGEDGFTSLWRMRISGQNKGDSVEEERTDSLACGRDMANLEEWMEGEDGFVYIFIPFKGMKIEDRLGRALAGGAHLRCI